MTELLTEAEHRVMELTGELWATLGAVIGNGRTRPDDLHEAALHIHAIQNMVLAQAAARGYPDRYRLLGQSVSTAPSVWIKP